MKNDGFVATAKSSSSLSSAMFPIRETWMVLCATCISKFLKPSFSYKFLLQETWIVCQGPNTHTVAFGSCNGVRGIWKWGDNWVVSWQGLKGSSLRAEAGLGFLGRAASSLPTN